MSRSEQFAFAVFPGLHESYVAVCDQREEALARVAELEKLIDEPRVDKEPTILKHLGGYVWTDCIECGVDVTCDEDGCCVSCGREALRYGREEE